MVKEPRAGRVKTRLGRDLGMTAAAWWFRHQSQKLIRRMSRDPRWQTVLAVAPDIEGLSSRVWPANLPRWAQGGGNLGDRMGNIFRAGPTGPIIIIGADIPGITSDLINHAFEKLTDHEAVLGPAPDGGYWLVGLKRGAVPVPQGLFKDVRWSHAETMNDTIKSLGDCRVGYVASLRDVDTIKDLKTQKGA